jgi:hypothetical protein
VLGLEEGVAVGDAPGCLLLGPVLGPEEGGLLLAGPLVGFVVGSPVGSAVVGIIVGTSLGDPVGAAVGYTVGSSVGALVVAGMVGETDCEAVGPEGLGCNVLVTPVGPALGCTVGVSGLGVRVGPTLELTGGAVLEQLQFTWKSNQPYGLLPPLAVLYSSTKAVVSDPETTEPSWLTLCTSSWTMPSSE